MAIPIWWPSLCGQSNETHSLQFIHLGYSTYAVHHTLECLGSDDDGDDDFILFGSAFESARTRNYKTANTDTYNKEKQNNASRAVGESACFCVGFRFFSVFVFVLD